MKRSHTVVLSAVVAAAGVFGAKAQTPTTKAGSIDCIQARNAAKASGTAVPQECAVSAHGVSLGGFGFLGRLHGATG
jgi:hypothetical protein